MAALPYHDDDEDDDEDDGQDDGQDDKDDDQDDDNDDEEGGIDLVPLDRGFCLSDKTTVAHTNLETSLNCDDESKYDDDDDKGDEYTGGW